MGRAIGVLTLTPYDYWRRTHAIHHATSGNLDKRGTGDVWTMTVQEYLESSRLKRFAYRLARNPVILFVIAPVFLFMVRQRFPSSSANRREKLSVWWMNLAIFGMAAALSWVFGIVPYLIIQVTIIMVAGAAGIWMFYVQHQFEDGARIGITPRRRSRVARSTSCRAFCSGSPVTSAFITSIISARASPTTTWSAAIARTRSFSRSRRSRCARA